MSKTKTSTSAAAARKPVPEGWMRKPDGSAIEIDMIDPIELAQDALVGKWVQRAQELRAEMEEFKANMLVEFDQYIQMSARKSRTQSDGLAHTGRLFSFDATLRLDVQRAVDVVYDNRIGEARQQLRLAVEEMGEGASAEFRTLVSELLNLGDDGTVKSGKITQLKKFKLANTRITKAIELLNKSAKSIPRGRYARFYVQDANGKYQPVSLDLAAI